MLENDYMYGDGFTEEKKIHEAICILDSKIIYNSWFSLGIECEKNHNYFIIENKDNMNSPRLFSRVYIFDLKTKKLLNVFVKNLGEKIMKNKNFNCDLRNEILMLLWKLSLADTNAKFLSNYTMTDEYATINKHLCRERKISTSVVIVSAKSSSHAANNVI